MEIVKALGSFDGERLKMAKLSAEEAWKLHLRNDHVPYRRDCLECVMARGTGKRHVKVKNKSAYALSMDVMGPFRIKGEDAYGKGYRFAMIFTYTFPKLEGTKEEVKIVEGDKDEESDLDAQIEELFADIKDPPEKDKRPDEHEAKAEGEAEAEGEDKGKDEGIVMDTIYFVKPLKTKTSKEVFEKVKEVYVELRNENLPVTRLHGDRAHEFFSAPSRSGALDRDVEVTRTEGQSPQSNGTAESAVRYLKGRVKLLLGALAVGIHSCRPPAEGAEVEGRGTKEGMPVRIACLGQAEGYGQGGRYDLMPRWGMGRPAWDVKDGSVIWYEDTERFIQDEA